MMGSEVILPRLQLTQWIKAFIRISRHLLLMDAEGRVNLLTAVLLSDSDSGLRNGQLVRVHVTIHTVLVVVVVIIVLIV